MAVGTGRIMSAGAESAAEIGRRAERATANLLCGMGFEVLDRNWRCGRYELDLVARRGGRIHFVEVRCRGEGALFRPEETLSSAKCRALLRAANAYIDREGLDCETQIDLIAADRTAEGTLSLRYIPHAVEGRW